MSAPRVLVIDDDAAVQNLFDALLRRAGCDVDHADNGLTGLEKLDGGDYAVIIVDLMLPKLGGLELLDQLGRKDPSILKKIIVASGASKNYLNQIDGRRVHAVIRKPFDIDHMVREVLSCANVAREPTRSPHGR